MLLRGFGLDQQTAYDCLTKFEKQAYEYSVNELRLVFKDQTNSVLLRKFKDEFFKDESGRSRHWPEIEEAKIQELFDVAKAKVGALLNEFRKVVIP